jgi:uncharacterized membrane protein YfcA
MRPRNLVASVLDADLRRNAPMVICTRVSARLFRAAAKCLTIQRRLVNVSSALAFSLASFASPTGRTPPPPMLIPAAVFGLVALTSFVSGIFGVAGGLILMGGLVYVMPVSQAMIVHGFAQFVSNVVRVYHWRHFILRRTVMEFIAASVFATTIFAWVRFVPSKPILIFVLGLSTLAVLLLPNAWAPKMTHRYVPFLCGLAGTALILTAGVSGTFLDQFFQRTGLDRKTIIATKAAMQTTQHLIKVGYFLAVATVEPDATMLTLLAIVPFAALLGANIARHVLERMTDHQFNWWTYRIVLVLGVYYVIDGGRRLLGFD